MGRWAVCAGGLKGFFLCDAYPAELFYVSRCFIQGMPDRLDPACVSRSADEKPIANRQPPIAPPPYARSVMAARRSSNWLRIVVIARLCMCLFFEIWLTCCSSDTSLPSW